MYGSNGPQQIPQMQMSAPKAPQMGLRGQIAAQMTPGMPSAAAPSVGAVMRPRIMGALPQRMGRASPY